ncbi:MAG: hypothetical protein JWO61_101 [Candidatus Saccharibacteria bacterium]|nr:hypothetical protein [Candidatus Saccharibacteria bacterium]
MLGRFIGIAGVVAAIVLLFFATITTPTQAGPLGILVVFLCLYVMMFSGMTFLIVGLQRIIVKLASPFTARKPLQPMSVSRAYYFSSVLSLGPVMLIGMQSVGSVGIYEFGLVTLFMVIGCVYIAKRST